MPDPEDLQKEIFGDSDEELSEEEGERVTGTGPRTRPELTTRIEQHSGEANLKPTRPITTPTFAWCARLCF